MRRIRAAGDNPAEFIETSYRVCESKFNAGPESMRRAFGKRGPAPKLQQQMDRIARLPKAQQRFVMQVIESVLAQAGR